MSTVQVRPPDPMCVVTTIRRDGICVLTVVGELDDRMVRLVDAEADRIASCRHLILDLAECSTVPADVSVLVRRLASHLDEAADLAVVSGSPGDAEAVREAVLDGAVRCYPLLADALTAARLDRSLTTRRAGGGTATRALSSRRADGPSGAERPVELPPGLRLVGGERRYPAEWL